MPKISAWEWLVGTAKHSPKSTKLDEQSHCIPQLYSDELFSWQNITYSTQSPLLSCLSWHTQSGTWSSFKKQVWFTESHSLFLLLIKHYNLYKVLACSMAFFQLSLFCAIFFQLCTFIFLISSKTSFSQCVLGLPIGLLDMGFHLLIFCTHSLSYFFFTSCFIY